MSILNLTKRNIKMFFKDKGLVLSSLITPLILILLYVTFLKNVYVDAFNSSLQASNISVSSNYVNGFVYGWLFSSLIAVSGVTVAFCSNLLMVQDKVTGAINDIKMCPISNKKIAIAYYIASMSVTMIIVFIEIFIGFIFLAISGWFLSFIDVIQILVGSFLLVNFGTALSSIIHHFLTTQGQMSAVGTLVSSVYGFICGAYMPINKFGITLQRILGFLPSTYATTFIRDGFEKGVLQALSTDYNFSSEVVNIMTQNFDLTVNFFGNTVPSWVSGLILFCSVAIFLTIYIAININKNKKIKQKIN